MDWGYGVELVEGGSGPVRPRCQAISMVGTSASNASPIATRKNSLNNVYPALETWASN
jgi:hypothetical protein